MIRKLAALAVLLLGASLAHAQAIYDCYNGIAMQGGQNVAVNGIQSNTFWQQSYPAATVQVYLTGTTTPATIFQDAAGTIPIPGGTFSASSTGVAFWCAADSHYDVQYSNGGIVTPFTVSDIHLAFNGGGGGGGSVTITTATGSGLQGGGSGNSFNLSLIQSCSATQELQWNGTAWACSNPAIWSEITSPTANLNLPLQNGGVAYTTTFINGDYGVTPAAAGAMVVTDNATSTTDTTPNFAINTGNGSYHLPFQVSLTTGGSTFAQLSVCNNGSNHLGFTAIGNSISCPNLSTSPSSKLWIMDNSNGHSQLTLYMNGTGATQPMLRFNTATVAASAPNFFTACAGATPGVDGTCGSTGNVAALTGLGGFQGSNFSNLLGTAVTLNGVVLTGQPGSAGLCPTSASSGGGQFLAATWAACGSGGGGGGTGAQFQSAYFGATNTVNGFGPGITGQIPVSQGASLGPAFLSQGIAGSTVGGATYTIACDSGTATVDRLTTILFNHSGTTTVTVPDPSATGCGSNFTFSAYAATGTTVVFNRTSTATFTTVTGTAYTASLTTFTLNAGQWVTISSPDNANYVAREVVGGSGSSSLWSALGNPNAGLSLAMTTFASTFTYSTNLSAAFLWTNSTVATNLTTNASPLLSLQANYWTGSASATDTWSIGTSLAAGTNGASTLTIADSGTSGTQAVSIPNLIIPGTTAHTVPVAENTGIFAYKSPGTSGQCFVSNGTSADPTFQSCPAGSTTFPITVGGSVNSGGIPYFNSATQMSSSATGTVNTLMKWGGAGAAPAASSITDAGTTIVAAEGFQFSGASGAATTISTQSNANLFLSPNGTGETVFINGTATNPSIVFAAGTGYGFYSASATNIALGTGSSAHDSLNFTSAGLIRAISGGAYTFTNSSTDATTAADTGISRGAAAVVDIGNGTPGNTSGLVKAGGLISGGTLFTTNSGCSETSLTGGASAGSFTLGAASCSVVVGLPTTTNSWACFVRDTSTPAGSLGSYTSTTNNATFAFTLSAQIGDVIKFGCIGF